MGPVPVTSRVITPLIGVKSPQLPNYKAIYRVHNSIYNWKGPTLWEMSAFPWSVHSGGADSPYYTPPFDKKDGLFVMIGLFSN